LLHVIALETSINSYFVPGDSEHQWKFFSISTHPKSHLVMYWRASYFLLMVFRMQSSG